MAILRRYSAVLSILACSAATPGCDFIREPLAVTLAQDQASLMSVLSAGDSVARVLLTLVPATSDPFDPSGEPALIAIPDAHVRLVAGADTVTLVGQAGAAENVCVTGPLHDGSPARALLPGCYVGTVPGGILSGASYVLIAEIPGHGRVEGRTTVPAPPVVVAPSSGSFIQVWADGPAPDPTLVEWSGVAAGGSAELRVQSRDDEQCGVYLTTGAGVGQVTALRVDDASSAEIIVRMSCATPATEVAGDIMVTAFDTAYARFARTMSDNREMSEASAGLTGPAIGAMGSAATARQRVQFVRD